MSRKASRARFRPGLEILLAAGLVSLATCLGMAARGASPQESIAARDRIRRALAAMKARDAPPLSAKAAHVVPAMAVAQATSRPVPLTWIDPAPPVAEVLAGGSGQLDVECVVTVEGLVADCVVVRSWPAFEAPALAALGQWRFRPALVDGEPRAVLVTWSWKHDAGAPARDWKPGWTFQWDRGTVRYQW